MKPFNKKRFALDLLGLGAAYAVFRLALRFSQSPGFWRSLIWVAQAACAGLLYRKHYRIQEGSKPALKSIGQWLLSFVLVGVVGGTISGAVAGIMRAVWMELQ